jgi:hypothetical protein
MAERLTCESTASSSTLIPVSIIMKSARLVAIASLLVGAITHAAPIEKRSRGGVERSHPNNKFVVLVRGDDECGGALIDLDYVLTSARCALSRKAHTVVVGPRFEAEVIEQFVHPEYKEGTASNDLIILKLAKSVPDDVATPIAIADRADADPSPDTTVTMLYDTFLHAL